MDSQGTTKMYPLDQNRRLLSETITTDPKTGQQIIKKQFRLTSQDGETVDVEFEQHLPLPDQQAKEKISSLYENKKVVSFTKDAHGNLHQITLVDDKTGDTKEYFVVEAKKRAAETQLVDPELKRSKAMATEIDPLVKLLLTTKVEELKNTEEGKIFVAYRHESAQQVFQALMQHQFQSCPVLNRLGVFHGFVDMLDYVNYFIGDLAGKDMQNPGTEMWAMSEKQSLFNTKKVKDIMTYPLSSRNVTHPMMVGYSLFAACEALALEPHLRRIPILSWERKMVNLITQSQILEFIWQNISLMDSKKRSKTLAQMPELFHEVISVKSSEFALEAFKKMHQFGLSGIAVVNEESKLVGNISEKDLRGIDTDGKWVSRMFANCDTYTQEVYAAQPETRHPKQLIVAKSTNTLEEVIKMVIENGKIHRVYVVDEFNKPIGVVGLRDILQQIIAV